MKLLIDELERRLVGQGLNPLSFRARRSEQACDPRIKYILARGQLVIGIGNITLASVSVGGSM